MRYIDSETYKNNSNSIYIDKDILNEGSILIDDSIHQLQNISLDIEEVVSRIYKFSSKDIDKFSSYIENLSKQKNVVSNIVQQEQDQLHFSRKIDSAVTDLENKTNISIGSDSYNNLKDIFSAAGYSVATTEMINAVSVVDTTTDNNENTNNSNTTDAKDDSVSNDNTNTASNITISGSSSDVKADNNSYQNTASTVTNEGVSSTPTSTKTNTRVIYRNNTSNTENNSNVAPSTTTTPSDTETVTNPNPETSSNADSSSNGNLFDPDYDYDYDDDDTSKVITTSSSSGLGTVIGGAAVVGAAAAIGVGAKVYKDRKENNDLELDEDSPTNGNRFWSNDEQSVIHSEKEEYTSSSEDTSDSYEALKNDPSINNDSWDVSDNTTSSSVVDLLE